MNRIIITHFVVEKVKNLHVFNGPNRLLGNAYRVATLSKLYLTYIGIIIQSFKLTVQF